ncbi:MAG TPA: chemotaxis protein CheW [Chloroflexi bacterium]|jgi:purine-binding chemotaxis protein CheW|nr:chemotaxis protein CheW [Chloroflexota bacterium]
MAIETKAQVAEEQVVVFALAQERYGLDISRVQGIIKMPEVTRVPRAAAFVEGVINLRGEIVPIIDLRKRFGLLEHEIGVDTRIINVEMGDHLVGLIVDAVEEVLNIPTDVIEPPPDLVTTVDSAYLRGIAKLDERLVILLDLDRVLSVAEQQALSRVAAETA